MEMKRICADGMCTAQMVSLMEIARGISSVPPEWSALRQRLCRYDAWGFFDRGELVGYGLADGKSPYCGGSVRLVELKYRWQYNQEEEISWMLRRIAGEYRLSQKLIVLDVNARRELNLELYKKLGFKPSVMASPSGRENVVLVCPLESMLQD